MRLPRSSIALNEVTGLEPTTWVSVGPGFSREEIKELLLSAGTGGLVAQAVTNPAEIAAQIVMVRLGAIELLGPISRQEALRRLLSDRRVSERLPELRRMRRQAGFFRKLDEAIQAGRAAAASAEELEIYDERLTERYGLNPLRTEMRMVEVLWNAWLEGSGEWDAAKAIRQANQLLASENPAVRSILPKRILHLSASQPESLELSLWEALARYCEIQRPPVESKPLDTPRQVAWEIWHTADDAAERLACSVTDMPEDSVVLIPDLAPVRRSLKRALQYFEVPEADTRDPNRLHQEESVKWALMPLELVARGFQRDSVQAWLATSWAGIQSNHSRSEIVAEINSRGIRQGLHQYSGAMLVPLKESLQELERTFGGRRTVGELAEKHLHWLRTRAQVSGDESAVVELLPVFDAVWRAFDQDLEKMGEKDRRAPLLYWYERFEERLLQTPSPVARLKPAKGLRVLRLSQVPLDGLAPPRKLWIFGMPAHWLSAEGMGDPWLSEREREALSSDFAVRAGTHARQERLAALRAWILPVLDAGGEVTVLDCAYGPDGRELESVGGTLREVVEGTGAIAPEEPSERGAHVRWLASFGSRRPLQPQSPELSPVPPGESGLPEVTATAIDYYSRCPFQALAFARWKVRDVREPDTELWPDVRGNLLHEAVRLLLQSRDENGEFRVTPLQALESAWSRRPPRGLIRSSRLENYLKARLLRVLETFCADEREYFGRSHARVVSLDDREFKLRTPHAEVRGKPDRVDQTDAGLFIMDYKTSSSLPTGRTMIEKGLRLQLPFYALAAGATTGQKVLGVQFVKLTRDGGRGNGIFFPAYNGNQAGKLTALTNRSHSLISNFSEEEVWARLEEHIVRELSGLVRGFHPAAPKEPELCHQCDARDLCGFGRRVSDGLQGAEEESG